MTPGVDPKIDLANFFARLKIFRLGLGRPPPLAVGRMIETESMWQELTMIECSCFYSKMSISLLIPKLWLRQSKDQLSSTWSLIVGEKQSSCDCARYRKHERSEGQRELMVYIEI